MAEFKLVIGDPKTGKSTQIVVSEDNADKLNGKKIGDKIKGEAIDLPGYEFEITGGADYCGFPMRKDIEGPVRKKVLLVSGVGIRNKEKGIRKRKTVCGNTIHDRITQISMKILKHGKKPIKAEEAPAEGEEAPVKEEKPVEKPKEAVEEEKPKKRKDEPEEEKKEDVKEEKPAEAPKEAPKDKPEEEKKEEPKEEKKEEEKVKKE